MASEYIEAILDNDDDDDLEDDSCASGPFDYWFDSDNLALYLATISALVTVAGYFLQRNIERREQAEAEKQQLEETDRQQALDRVRRQLSVYVGPLHRLIKTQNSTFMQCRQSMGVGLPRGRSGYWDQFFPEEIFAPFIEDPQSLEARQYRAAVVHRLTRTTCTPGITTTILIVGLVVQTGNVR